MRPRSEIGRAFRPPSDPVPPRMVGGMADAQGKAFSRYHGAGIADHGAAHSSSRRRPGLAGPLAAAFRPSHRKGGLEIPSGS